MIFKYFETGPLMVNCYIVGDEKSREAIVVDPGGDVENILDALKEDDLKVKMIINTHAHFDHIGGNKGLSEATGAGIYIHPDEKEMLMSMNSMAMHFGTEDRAVAPPCRVPQRRRSHQAGRQDYHPGPAHARPFAGQHLPLYQGREHRH